MKIHEYQGKEILRHYGVTVPRGIPCTSVDEAVNAAQTLGGPVWVVKAQIHAGGRGKGGGVKVAKSIDEVRQYASSILGMQLVTHQTSPAGQKVRRLLIEEGADIKKELYVSMVTDRVSQRVVLMASSEGGMDIEEVAAHSPEKIIKEWVDPAVGIQPFQARKIASGLGLKGDAYNGAVKLIMGVYKTWWECDASMVEINPLAVVETPAGKEAIICVDAKIGLDDNALYRHPDIQAMRDLAEESPLEIEASKFALNYIKLDGSIACLVNGAGLAMSTMDIIQHFGGMPANFLDVGGGASKDQVSAAFKIILSDPNVKAIFVNIFGGIMDCNVIATGIVEAVRETGLKLPLVVRLEGNNVAAGKATLAASGLTIISGDTMADAAKKVVASVAA
jgi:succinyl-CoA synthetase beta subunit